MNQCRRVVIMSGVPGSGKSTLVKQHPIWSKGEVCSADHYFEKLGRFDPLRLAQAHNECLLRFVDLIETKPIVVVDNTNLTELDIAPYFALATAYGYPVEIVTVLCDPIVAAERNIHGAPEATVQKMNRVLRRRYFPARWTFTNTVINN